MFAPTLLRSYDLGIKGLTSALLSVFLNIIATLPLLPGVNPVIRDIAPVPHGCIAVIIAAALLCLTGAFAPVPHGCFASWVLCNTIADAFCCS